MKKFISLGILLAATLTSCTSEDIQSEPNPYHSVRISNNGKQFEYWLGSEKGYDRYIRELVQQYRDCIYDLTSNYMSPNPIYNNMKIKILGDKMAEFVESENYMEAAILRDKINRIKEKGK